MAETIVINGKYLCSPLTGVQRYALELFRHIDVLLGEAAYQNIRLVCLAPRCACVNPGWKNIELCQVGSMPANIWEQTELPLLARGRLLFSPANTGPLLYFRQVITMHDAAVFAMPEAYSGPFRVKYFIIFNLLARYARAVLTDSTFSYNELIRYLGVKAERFHIIPLGGDHIQAVNPEPGTLQKYGLSKNAYLLSVASQSKHKNFGRVVQAVSLLESQVLLAAAGGSNDQIFQTPELQPASRKVCWLGYVSDSELKALYENALGFIFPSLYEGFGLPILEAMNCGCPVLCSTAASIPEVAGSAALYFNPLDFKDIARVVDNFLVNPELRSDLRVRGFAQASRFTWDGTARKTLDHLTACL